MEKQERTVPDHAVAFEVEVKRETGSKEESAVKARLEMEQQVKGVGKLPQLEDLLSKLEHAAELRSAQLQQTQMRLRGRSQELEIKVQRKRSSDSEEQQEHKAKHEAELQLAQERRRARLKQVIDRLQSHHDKIIQAYAEVSARRTDEVTRLRLKLQERLAEREGQRERAQQEKVQKLAEYHEKVLQAVQDAKEREEQKAAAIATAIQQKQAAAQENKLKHTQHVKALAVEVADKVKELQAYVYDEGPD